MTRYLLSILLCVCATPSIGFIKFGIALRSRSSLSRETRTCTAGDVSTSFAVKSTLAMAGFSQPEYSLVVYYIAGAVCASSSHAFAIPIDVIKTRQQTDRYLQELGPVDALKEVVGRDGLPSLLQGASPTIVGYALQGSLKYGIYEFLKPIVAASIVGSSDSSFSSTILDFLISGALAETVGSSVLTPFEAARIRLVLYPDYAKGGGVVSCMYRMGKDEGLQSLFLGYPAIISKQIPYTAASLCTFEMVTKYIYSQLLGVGTAVVNNPTIGNAVAQGIIGGEMNTAYGDSTVITSAATAIVTMESIPSITRFEVTFAAAVSAALIGAVVSQPGDTLLSVINKRARIVMEDEGSMNEGVEEVFPLSASDSPESTEKGGGGEECNPITVMMNTAKELGVNGLFAGFKARLLHVMTIVVLQLLIYDYAKQLVGSIIH